MKPTRRALARVPLLLTLILPVAVGCGTNAPQPSATPTPSVSPAPSPAPTASPSDSPSPTATVPTATQPPAQSGWTVVSSRVAYQWRWPNWNGPATVTHKYPVPPLPTLVAIGAGNHPNDPGDRPYNRMTFTFGTAFPSYHFQFEDKLVADGSGNVIPLEGLGVLRVVFTQAQAHNPNGTSSVTTKPPAHLGMKRMVAWAPAGDFEGVVTYGIGIAWEVPHSNPQIAVRAYEVTYVNAQGTHRYVVAIDVDAR